MEWPSLHYDEANDLAYGLAAALTSRSGRGIETIAARARRHSNMAWPLKYSLLRAFTSIPELVRDMEKSPHRLEHIPERELDSILHCFSAELQKGIEENTSLKTILGALDHFLLWRRMTIQHYQGQGVWRSQEGSEWNSHCTERE